MSSRARIEASLRACWRGESPWLGAALRPLSWAYRSGVAVDKALHAVGVLPTSRLNVPVLSVGNLVVGGAGKTPVTLEIARRLLDSGRRVAVLSRGYGRESTARVVIVSDGDVVRVSAREGGDEPVWLARRLPGLIVVVASKRAEAAEVALELGADLMLLDDGFSHRALARDADVLVVDDELRLGNRQLLPAGPLREPVSAARRASLLWLTRWRGTDDPLPAGLDSLPLVRSTYEPDALVDLDLRPLRPLRDLVGRDVAALCGIARPESFQHTLEAAGAKVVSLVAFSDHHAFTPQDVERIQQESALHPDALVVTTEKDAMRLSPLMPPDAVAALRMSVRMAGDDTPLRDLLRPYAFAPQREEDAS